MAAISTNNAAHTSFFHNLRMALHNWMQRRETRIELERLSERELNDIGLCRADIDRVAAHL